MNKTVEEAAQKYANIKWSHPNAHIENLRAKADFEYGAMSDATRDYWYAQFQQEQKHNAGVLPLNFDKPYCTTNVIEYLVKGCEYLLKDKSYDGHDYEEISNCVESGKKLISHLSESASPKQNSLTSDVAVRFSEWKTKYYLDYNEGKYIMLKSDYMCEPFPQIPKDYLELFTYFIENIYGK